MLTTSPDQPTRPANVTLPAVAERAGVPTGAAMSMPRCWPDAYGLEPFLYAVMTAPRTGQLQPIRAAADDAGTSRRRRERRAARSGLIAPRA
jgi:hypothetical protein